MYPRINKTIIFLTLFLFFSAAGVQAATSKTNNNFWERLKRSWSYLIQKEDNILPEINESADNSSENKLLAENQTIKIIDEQSHVIDVVRRNSPAVVSIIASAEMPKYEQCYKQGSPFFGLPPEFQNFFDYQIPSWCQNGTEKKRIGAGTGFIVSADGYIVSNKHVVENEKAEYTVILNDQKNVGKKITAKVLARDPNNDIAILKIDEKNLPFIALGDSKNLQVGQTVIAIGYALGEFDNTVSKGVVSGLSRNITAGGSSSGIERLRGLIQTDAAINPGNSGGPLLDLNGKAIGMNTAMADGQSIGFAIPIDKIKNVFDQVRKSGKIEKEQKAFLGIRYIPINNDLKERNKLPFDYGMLVVRGETANDLAVMPGSPADKAGIVENDILLEADGKKLNENYTLADVMENKKAGDKITIKIYHKGSERELKITLGEN